ncbi:protein of unknown function [Nocardia amikacinitolerans]|uniref:DUF397 domain-containing protein n=1 Tax=Nocardia amikacinitolerans TaxID=756689 RepID=A0A285LR74_9NOCA|nr:DUF397 domain-containing protein [Nocardia amikacinitolerans]MCP2276655.1 protein of unknown function (DUF397) [Nocardia amikacinitolerans]MCP2294964.1 protein of unknown function (DUF397) [Nocardia amikacinitolerans]SNY87395.1 protein of unknown function [Nocardia amikacinitolerans]
MNISGGPVGDKLGAAVELADAEWRKAGGAGPDGVEVALLAAGHVALRSASDPDGHVLIFTPGEWAAFTAGVHDGEFDLP